MLKRRLALFCVLTIGVAACSKGEDNNKPSNNQMMSETIGPDGGEVSISGGTSVSIPAGALSEDVTIAISELSASDTSRLAATLGADVELVSSLFAFTPHGTTFASNVDIEIPYESSRSGLKVMRLDDENDTTWEEVGPASFSSGSATLASNTFSVLGVVAPVDVVTNNDAGPADTGGGSDMGSDMVTMVDAGADGGAADMGPMSNYANLPGSWTITRDIPGTGEPHAALNSTGDAVVAWANSVDGLFVSERTAGVWTHPADATDFVTLTGTNDYFEQGLVTSGIADNGDAAVSMVGRISSDAAIFRSTRSAGVWNHPADATDRIDFPLEQASHFGTKPSMKMAPDGTGLMTWYTLYNGIYGSLAGGGTWSAPNDLALDALNVGGNWGAATGANAVGVANGGRAIVAHDQDDAAGNFYYASTYDGSWTRGTRFDVPGTRGKVWAAMGNNGDALVAWVNQVAWDGCQSCAALYVAEYTGGVWSQPADADDYFNLGGAGLLTVSNSDRDVYLGVTDTGDAVVIYEQYVNGAQEIFVAERVGGVWSKPAADEFVPFPPATASASDHAAAICGNGDIAIMRNSDVVGVYTHRYVAQRIDGVWYVPEGLGDVLMVSDNGSQWPNLAMSTNGEVILTTKANNDSITIAEFTPQ